MTNDLGRLTYISMKTLEEWKIEITLKVLANTLTSQDIKDLPIDDEIRAFSCSLGPRYARMYAQYVDRRSRDNTRQTACQDPEQAYWYALLIDHGPTTITRNAACKNETWREAYLSDIDKVIFSNRTHLIPIE